MSWLRRGERRPISVKRHRFKEKQVLRQVIKNLLFNKPMLIITKTIELVWSVYLFKGNIRCGELNELG